MNQLFIQDFTQLYIPKKIVTICHNIRCHGVMIWMVGLSYLLIRKLGIWSKFQPYIGLGGFKKNIYHLKVYCGDIQVQKEF